MEHRADRGQGDAAVGEGRDRLLVGPSSGLANQVRARVAATKLQVQRARQRVAQAMAQVRHVDQLLHPEPVDDPVQEHWP